MFKISFVFTCWFFTALSLSAQPHKIIFDTDIDSDVDDVGALAMLHTLADHNVVEILGVIVTSDDRHAVPCTDVINHYFKRPQIPIGAQKSVALREHSRYTKELSEEFPHRLKTAAEAEDAVALYRKLLTSEPDSSVTIITVGHLTNLRNLIESGPCKISSLTGMELIKKKVRSWICMGGQFPEGKEANFYRPDPESTRIAVEKWPVPVVFAGWEVGNDIITGGEFLKNAIPKVSPVWRAYQLYNNFQGRQSWDQVAVLYAVSPDKGYFDEKSGGYTVVAEDGSNRWIGEKQTNQSYLIEKVPPLEIAKIIDALMTGIYRPGF
jgi:inosine-uridine nucleoside N-ribohydrolase